MEGEIRRHQGCGWVEGVTLKGRDIQNLDEALRIVEAAEYATPSPTGRKADTFTAWGGTFLKRRQEGSAP